MMQCANEEPSYLRKACVNTLNLSSVLQMTMIMAMATTTTLTTGVVTTVTMMATSSTVALLQLPQLHHLVAALQLPHQLQAEYGHDYGQML